MKVAGIPVRAWVAIVSSGITKGNLGPSVESHVI